jgi:hypothetical protein
MKDIVDSIAAALANISNAKYSQTSAFVSSGGDELTSYVPPEDDEASVALLDATIKAAQSVDAAQAAADAAAQAFDDAANVGDWSKFSELLRKKAEADALLASAFEDYNVVTGINNLSESTGGGGGPGGRFGMQMMSKGGMVKPNYFAMGGFAKGTDTVPAMLTPGEFVMSKYAVDSYGVDKMKAINSGSYEGEKVYNYNLNVNVKSDANPEDIARVVMTQIRQVDSQRIRTQRA